MSIALEKISSYPIENIENSITVKPKEQTNINIFSPFFIIPPNCDTYQFSDSISSTSPVPSHYQIMQTKAVRQYGKIYGQNSRCFSEAFNLCHQNSFDKEKNAITVVLF